MFVNRKTGQKVDAWKFIYDEALLEWASQRSLVLSPGTSGYEYGDSHTIEPGQWIVAIDGSFATFEDVEFWNQFEDA